jgi:hypothetical protein
MAWRGSRTVAAMIGSVYFLALAGLKRVTP